MRRAIGLVASIALAAACGTHSSLDLAGSSATPTPTGTATPSPSPSATPTPPFVPGQVAKGSVSTADTVSATFPASATLHDLIVVSVVWFGTSVVPSISDEAGNSYTQAGMTQTTPGGSRIAVLYAADVTPATTVTAVLPVPTRITLLATEFRTLSTTNPLAATGATLGTSASPSNGSVTPDASGSVVYVAMAHDSPNTTAAGARFTLLAAVNESANPGAPLAAEYAVYRAGDLPVPLDFSLTSPDGWGQIFALFTP